MHYLPCEHCGHFNPVKSEYLVFCEKCGKKLSNNYKDWLKRNHGKNLDDFKAGVCSSEEAKEYLQKASKKKKTGLSKAQIAGIAAGVIFAVVGSYFGKQAAQKWFQNFSLKRMNNVEYQASDTTKWVVYQNQEANFKAKFPALPKETVQSVDTQIGKIDVKVYSFEPTLGEDENVLYSAAFTNYPEETVDSEQMTKEMQDSFLKSSVDGAVANVDGKLITTNVIAYQGYPGSEILVDFKEGAAVIKMRFYLVKSRLYMTQVITPTKNAQNKAIDAFLNSLEIEI